MIQNASDSHKERLTMSQCVAGVAYLVAMLAVLWRCTGSVSLVTLVLVISLIAGGIHVRLSKLDATRLMVR